MADVVSTGEAFSSTGSRREIWPTPVEVAVGTALFNVAGDKAGVAYTNSGGFTRVDANTANPATINGIPAGGSGLDLLQVGVATDGSYEFPVVGATKATPNGTQVYAVVATNRITGLTLTATANVKFGTVNNPQDYLLAGPAGAFSCVKIGG